MTLDEKISQMVDHAAAIPRLQVPSYVWWNESLHGVAFAGTAGVTLAVEKNQQPDKLPPANDPANCPICQEMLHAGVFVAPGAAALQLATLVAVIDFVFVEIFATTQTYAHGWKSRAPPIA